MKYTEKDFGLPITLLLFFIKVTFGNELPQCPEGMSYMPSEMGMQCVPQMSQSMGGYGGMNMMAPMMPSNQMGNEMAAYPQQMMYQQPQQMSQMAMQMPAMPAQSLPPESMPSPPMPQMVAPLSKGPVLSVSYENNGEPAEADETPARYSDKHVDKPWKSKARERKRTSRPRSKTTPKSKSRTTTTLKPQAKRKPKKGSKSHPKALDIEIDYTDGELSLVTEQPDSLPADSTEKINADTGDEKQSSSGKKSKRVGNKHKSSKKEFLTAVLSYVSSDGRTVYRKKLSDKEAKMMLAATRDGKSVTKKNSAEDKKDVGSKEADSQEREKKIKRDNEQINISAGSTVEVKTASFKKKKQWQ